MRGVAKRVKQRLVFLWAYILIFLGVLLLFSAAKGDLGGESFLVRQCAWIVVGTVLMVLMKRVDYRDLKKFWPVIYLVVIFFLLVVLFVGGGGAARWIRVGWFNFQPSEFAKLAVIIALSAFFAERDPKSAKNFFVGLAIMAVPFLLVLRQPDLGTAFIFSTIFLGILYLAGAARRQFVYLFGASLLASPLFWFFMRPYQRERILTFLNPMSDPLDKGYNLLQSIITIGSGGFWGKGFMQGTQTKLAFLPEYHTDFIFSLLAEEFGFVGIMLLLGLYYLFLSTMADIISSSRDRFAVLLSTGIMTMFISQIVINIFMAMGLFPIVGIPLPFISYGGSSLLASLLAVIIIYNVKETWVL